MNLRNYHIPSKTFLYTTIDKGEISYPDNEFVQNSKFKTGCNKDDFETEQILLGFTREGVPLYEGDIVLYKQADGGILPACDKTYTCLLKKCGLASSVQCYDLDRDGSSFYYNEHHIVKVIGHRYDDQWKSKVQEFEQRVWKN